MALKVIELLVDDALTGDTRVEEIALVLQPAIETEFMWFGRQSFQTYNDYPQAAKQNACKVLRWRDEHGDDVQGMTQVGWTRANQLCNGENISRDTIARMSAFIRHKQNSEIAPEFRGEPWKDAGYVAWLGWGGTEGIEWAQRKLKQIDEEMGIETGNLQPWSKTSGDTEMCGCGSSMAEVGERGGIRESKKAPKSDTPNPNPQGEGSAKGDASGKRGAKVTAEQEKTLQKKVDDFNERESNTKYGNATLGALKSVFQRGLGAYNTSHSPSVNSAEQWAYARVNAFLYLLKNGRPENPKYVTDNDLLPKDHPKAETKMSMSEFELDVYGYQTKYFYICPGAQATFKDIMSVKPTEDSIGMIRSAAVVADKVFEIEEDVLENKRASEEQLSEAMVLVEDFKDIIGEIEKIQGKTFDVSYMDNHIKTIEGYVGQQNMGYPIGQIQKDSLISGQDCDCGCPYMDGCAGDNGLYFGTNMINGMPVFDSKEDAEAYADNIGCEGSHVHTIDGKEYYMPCEIHSPQLQEKVLDIIEDKGVELEDLLNEGWEIVDASPVDSEELKKEVASKVNKMSTEKFYRIVSTPNEPSVQDLGNKRFRYIYSTGMGRAELIDTSREFCRRMLGGRQFVFRYEDIMALSAQIDSEADNYKIIPRPKGTSVDIMTYKGGANCYHYFTQLIFQPSMSSIVGEQAVQDKITNNARRMLESADLAIPAPNQSGQVNPPVDYGSRSPQSVGLSQQFVRSSSQVIIVDMDDTLVRGNNPIKKTIDYVNRKAREYRIVIVSGRQQSRTEETKRQLDSLGVLWDEVYLSDFPVGPNASNAFKEYKAKWLQEKGLRVIEAIDNDFQARQNYSKLGIRALAPTSLKAVPKGFLQGLPIYEEMEDAKSNSEQMGCSGMVEEVVYLGKKMFQSCGYNMKKSKMSAQFAVDEEQRMLYSPAMKPGILIPRVDEMTREKYFVTFKPEIIKRMAQRFLIEKRTDKTNYEHSEQKFDGVYLVESWIVDSDNDKAYGLGYTKQDVPLGSWMVGYRVDNDEVWSMIKTGKVKGLSIEGNFEYKFSVEQNDEYLLKEIINILNNLN